MTSSYYNPEDFGLTVVGKVDFSSGCYEFDLTVVWRDTAGQLYYADDSGCSCPVPFDWVGINDMTRATPAEIQAHLEERSRERYDGPRDMEIAALMERIVGA